MTTYSQAIKQHSPNRPHFTVRWVAIAVVAVAVLGTGAWMLWNTPDLSSVPTVNVPADAVTLNADAADAQVPGSRPASAQADTATSATAEEAVTAADEVIATESEAVSESPQASRHIMAIAGTYGTVVWPSADGQLAQTVPVGEQLTATARSADSLWLYVQTDTTAGWAEAAQVYAFGLDSLPVLETPPSVDATVNSAPETAVSSAESALAVDESAETAVVEGPLTTDETTISAVVTLDSSRLNVRSGPSTESVIVAKAYPDEEFTAIGRDGSGEWLQLALPDVEGGFGWVSATYMALSESIDSLPVSTEVSSAPAFVSAPAAADGSGSAEPGEASVLASTDAASASVSGLNGTLAFQSSHGMIYVYDLETGAEWPLTTGFDPAISPDGTTVAFTRDGGENGIYLIGIDGSNERLIFSGREQLSSPKWNADGSEILFTYRTESQELVQVGKGDSAETKLMTDYGYHLAVVDRDGNNFYEVPALESARAADWIDAGIVYQSSDGIQIIDDVENAESRVVAYNNLNPFDYDPDWQSTVDGNGGQIAYMKQGASHWEIYVVHPDGSGMTALTQPVTSLVDELPSNVAPAYSPDGQYIAYLSNLGADNSADAWQIWVMEADGSNARPLSIDVEIEYTFGDEQAVSWGI